MTQPHRDKGAAFQHEHYVFEKWVPREMWPAAMARIRAGTNSPHKIPSEIDEETLLGAIRLQGHIDDPDVEGDRVVRVNAWGKPRYCLSNVEASSAKFVSWYKDGEEGFATAKAARQPGGLTELDGTAFDQLPAP